MDPAFSPTIDEREFRAAQGAAGVLLLGAFVFRVPGIVVAVAVIVAVGALFGPRANVLHAAYRAAVGPRLKPAEATVAVGDVRALDALAAGLLAVASVAIAMNIDVIAWLLVVVEAAIAAVAATTGYNAARELLDRMRRDG